MMKKIRLRTVFVYLLAVLAGALLLHTSQNVQKEEERLAAISAEANREKESIRVLKTEWAYLNNPGRLETLARKYLKLAPPDPARVAAEGEEIPAKLSPPAEAPPGETPTLAQPVSYTPVPRSKPSRPVLKNPVESPTIKNSPKEKSFDDILKQVTEGAE